MQPDQRFQEPPEGKELKLRDHHHNRHNKSNLIEEQAEEVTWGYLFSFFRTSRGRLASAPAAALRLFTTFRRLTPSRPLRSMAARFTPIRLQNWRCSCVSIIFTTLAR